MNKLVTWFFAASGAAFVALGVLAIIGGQYLIGAVIVALGGSDLFWVIRRRKSSAPETPPRPPQSDAPGPLPPPVPIPELRALAALHEPVTACPVCGFLGIRSGSGQSVYLGGPILAGCLCPRCGYRGLPLSVDKRADYIDFVGHLNETAKNTPPP